MRPRKTELFLLPEDEQAVLDAVLRDNPDAVVIDARWESVNRPPIRHRIADAGPIVRIWNRAARSTLAGSVRTNGRVETPYSDHIVEWQRRRSSTAGTRRWSMVHLIDGGGRLRDGGFRRLPLADPEPDDNEPTATRLGRSFATARPPLHITRVESRRSRGVGMKLADRNVARRRRDPHTPWRLWMLQGTTRFTYGAILCVANCTPVTGGSVVWLTAGFVAFLNGLPRAVAGARRPDAIVLAWLRDHPLRQLMQNPLATGEIRAPARRGGKNAAASGLEVLPKLRHASTLLLLAARQGETLPTNLTEMRGPQPIDGRGNDESQDHQHGRKDYHHGRDTPRRCQRHQSANGGQQARQRVEHYPSHRCPPAT